MQVELFEAEVAFWLEGKTAPRPHVPTAAEAQGDSGGRRTWDHVPNGQLRLRIMEHALKTTRRTCGDSHRARLEDLLNDFVVALAVAADGLRARTLCWKRWREPQEEARRQRELAEQRRKEEEARIPVLDQQVDDWTRAQQVRAFLDEAERRVSGKTSGVLGQPVW